MLFNETNEVGWTNKGTEFLTWNAKNMLCCFPLNICTGTTPLGKTKKGRVINPPYDMVMYCYLEVSFNCYNIISLTTMTIVHNKILVFKLEALLSLKFPSLQRTNI